MSRNGNVAAASFRDGAIGAFLRKIPLVNALARWLDDHVVLPLMLRQAGWHFGPHYAAIGKRKCLGFLRSSFEGETLAVFRAIVPRGALAIDVGANFGYFTRHLSDLVGPEGEVHAFEAHPGVFACLQKNVAGRKNVTLRHAAAADSEGMLELCSMDNPLAHSLFATGERLGTWTVQQRISVPALRLDDALPLPENDARPLVIKMDIEGAEPMALRGMERLIARAADIALVVEYSPACLEQAGSSGHSLLHWLWARGFTIYPIEHPVNEQIVPPSVQWHVNLLCVRGRFAEPSPGGIFRALAPADFTNP